MKESKDLIIYGSGGGGKDQQSSGGGWSETPNTLESDAVISIVDVIGEGQITGFEGFWAKNFYLNDLPYMSQSTTNDMSNTYFSTGTPPTYWHFPATPDDIVCTVTDCSSTIGAPCDESDYGLQVVRQNTTISPGSNNAVVYQDVTGLTPNTIYNLTAKVYNLSGNESNTRGLIAANQYVNGSYELYSSRTVSHDCWEEVTVSFWLQGTSARIFFWIEDDNTSDDTVYFSDFKLNKMSYTYNIDSFDWRWGSPYQDPHSKISSTESTTSVNLEATIGGDVEVPNVDTAGSTTGAIRVILQIPGLYRIDTSNGKMLEETLAYGVYIKSGTVAYTWVGDREITGKTDSDYYRRIEFPIVDSNGTRLYGDPPYTIKLVKTTYDSTSTRQCDLFFHSYVLISHHKFQMPDVASFAVQARAQQFDGKVPTRSYKVKGKCDISIPSNYDPVSRTYMGLWDGTFVTGWTNNPAWILYDLITNTRYGLNRNNDIRADKWEFYKIARWNDGQVLVKENGVLRYEHRFEMNVSLDAQEEAFHVINALAASMWSLPYYTGTIDFDEDTGTTKPYGLITLMQDSPCDATHIASAANVKDGFFNYTSGTLKDLASVALVTWYDQNQMGKAQIEVVEDKDLIKLIGWVQKDVIALGCTRRSQAIRYGRWILDTEKNNAELVKFTGGFDFIDCAPGNVIEVQDPMYMSRVRYSGRIKEITSTSMTIDDATGITIAAGKTYTLHMMPEDTTQKIINGEFATDTSDWTPYDAGTNVEISRVDFGSTTGGSDNWCLRVQQKVVSDAHTYCYQTINTVPGITYSLSTRAHVPDSMGANLKAGIYAVNGTTTAHIEDTNNTLAYDTTGTRTVNSWYSIGTKFVATGPLTTIVLWCLDGEDENYVHFDKVSVYTLTRATTTDNVVKNGEFTYALGAEWGASSGSDAVTITRIDLNSTPYATTPGPSGGIVNTENGVDVCWGLKVAKTSTGNNSYVLQATTLVPNVPYILSAKAYSPSANSQSNAAGISVGVGPTNTTTEDTWQTISIEFTPSSSSQNIFLVCSGTASGDIAYFDQVELKVNYTSIIERTINNSAASGVTVLTWATALSHTAQPFSTFPSVGGVWALSVSDNATRKFRCISNVESAPNEFDITGVLYDDDKWDRVEEDLVLVDPPNNNIPTGEIPAPTGLATYEFASPQGANLTPAIHASWVHCTSTATTTASAQADPRVNYYEIEITRKTSVIGTTDGDFSTDTGWSGDHWTITGGKAVHTAGAGNTDSLVGVTTGVLADNTYVVYVTVSDPSGGTLAGSLNVAVGAGKLTSDSFGNITSTGSYKFFCQAEADDSSLIFSPSADFNGRLDSVKIFDLKYNLVIANANSTTNSFEYIGIEGGYWYDIRVRGKGAGQSPWAYLDNVYVAGYVAAVPAVAKLWTEDPYDADQTRTDFVSNNCQIYWSDVTLEDYMPWYRLKQYDLEILTTGDVSKGVFPIKGVTKISGDEVPQHFELTFAQNVALFGTPTPSFKVRVRSVDIYDQVSDWTTITVSASTVTAPTTLVVTGGSTTEFVGPDCNVQWALTYGSTFHVSRFKHFNVRLMDGATELFHKEQKGKKFNFSRKINADSHGGVPSRDLSISITTEDYYGTESSAATLSVTDPAPSMSGYSPTVKDSMINTVLDWSTWFTRDNISSADTPADNTLEFNTNWTYTTPNGWSFTSYSFSHDSGYTSNLECATSTSEGTKYKLSFYLSGHTTGSLQVALGTTVVDLVYGISGAAPTHYTIQIISPSDNATLKFIPTSDFNGDIVGSYTLLGTDYYVPITLEVDEQDIDGFRVYCDGSNEPPTTLETKIGKDGSNCVVTGQYGVVSHYANPITGTDTNKYEIIKTHWSAASNRPITGTSWATYWSLYAGTAASDAWQSGYLYNDGFIRACVVPYDHFGEGTPSVSVKIDDAFSSANQGDLVVYQDANMPERLALGSDGQVLTVDTTQTLGVKWSTVAGTGDVVGPASSTDHAIVRYDGTTGKLLENSGITIDNDNVINSTGTIIVSKTYNGTTATSKVLDITVNDTTGTSGSGTLVGVSVTCQGSNPARILKGSGGWVDLAMSGYYMDVQLRAYSNTAAYGPFISGYKSRGTEASKTTVTANNILLALSGHGYYDATSSNEGGRIKIIATDTWSSTSTPTKVIFSTIASGSTSLTESASITTTSINIPTGSLFTINGSQHTHTSADVTGFVTSNTTTTVDSEIALFSGTTGQIIKRASGTGLATVTAGVLGTVAAPSGAVVGTSDSQTLSGKTLTTPVILSGGSINDDHGNEYVKFAHNDSAVNEITITNAVWEYGPTISSTGDNTDINLNFTCKGSGAIVMGNVVTIPSLKFSGDTGIIYDAHGNTSLTFTHGSSACVNYLDIQNAADGNSPGIYAAGSDPDVSISIIPKGSGYVNLYRTYTSTTGSFANLINSVIVAPSATDGTATYYGSQAYMYATGGSSITSMVGDLLYGYIQHTGTIASIYGRQIYLTQAGSGTLTNAIVLECGVSATGTSSSITNAYGIRVNTPTSGSGTISTLYGIKVESQAAGTTDSYGIYCEGTKNYFSGYFSSEGSAAFSNTYTGTVSSLTSVFSITGTGGSGSGTIVGLNVDVSGCTSNPTRIMKGRGGYVDLGFDYTMEFQLRSFSDGTSESPYVKGYKSRGTEASKTYTTDECILLGISGYGYRQNGTTVSAWEGSRINMIADADWSGTTDNPAKIVFSVTPSGTSAITEMLTLDGTGLNLSSDLQYFINSVNAVDDRLGITVLTPSGGDDTTAISNAIASNTHLYFTPGTFYYSALTVDVNNIVFQGAGRQLTTLCCTTTDADGITVGNGSTQRTHITFRDINFTRQAAASAGAEIAVHLAAYVTIDNCYVWGNSKKVFDAFFFHASLYSKIQNTVIDTIKNDAIILQGTNLTTGCVSEFTANNINIETAEGIGINCKEFAGFFLYNSIIYNTHIGVSIDPDSGTDPSDYVSFIIIAGNNIDTFVDYGIYLNRISCTMISGNIITGAAPGLYAASAASGVTVTGNRFMSNDANRVIFLDGLQSLVTGNDIHGEYTTPKGIDLGSNSSAAVISGNSYVGCTSYDEYNLGSAASSDVFPRDDRRGLFVRTVDVIGTPTDHFRSGSIPSGFAWAGSPFGTPNSIDYDYSYDYALFLESASAPLRGFLNKSITNASGSWEGKSIVARMRNYVGGIAGIRIDNGTDDYYVELYIQATSGVNTVKYSYKAGGSITTTSTAVTVPQANYITLGLQVPDAGQQTRFLMYSEDGGTVILASDIDTSGWIPAAGRVGLIMTAASNWDAGLFDWFYNTFT